MTPKNLLKHFGLDDIVGLDFETVWGPDYTLRKMATTDYIVDPRFGVHCVSVQTSRDKRAKVLDLKRFKAWLKTVDWKRTAMLAHHTQFDALILSHHFGIAPAFYLDTLSMARPVMPVTVGGSLDALCKAFGLRGKVGSEALVNTAGKTTLTPAEYEALAKYAGNDIEQTWALFKKLQPYTTLEELRLIDLTVKMYAQPSLLLDGKLLEAVRDNAVAHKALLLSSFGGDRAQFMSNDLFADLLRAHGVEPPTKISKTTGGETYAFSKQDIEFKKLLDHPDEAVAALVETRLGVKSTLLETRAERMRQRSEIGAQPIYLNYCGAHTFRWSGGDAVNWQNMTRGSDLRKALHAPRAKQLVIADLAQIEARLTAWLHGQHDLLAAFADKQDVYRLVASRIYDCSVSEVDAKMRFVGKAATLGLGFGMGASRFAETLRIGVLGPPVPISDADAQSIVGAWRSTNPWIVAGWSRMENNAKAAFFGGGRVEDNGIVFEGSGKNGFIHLPGGMSMRYDDVQMTEDGMTYLSKSRRLHNGQRAEKRSKLWGGIFTENVAQALARRVIAEHILKITADNPDAKLALTTHDELVFVASTRRAPALLKSVEKTMSTSPQWAPDLPLAVEAHISTRYDK